MLELVSKTLDKTLAHVTKPGSPAELRAVLIYRFSGELSREITIPT